MQDWCRAWPGCLLRPRRTHVRVGIGLADDISHRVALRLARGLLVGRRAVDGLHSNHRDVCPSH